MLRMTVLFQLTGENTVAMLFFIQNKGAEVKKKYNEFESAIYLYQKTLEAQKFIFKQIYYPQ